MTVLPILSEVEVRRITAVAALLQSDQDGEVVNAGRLLVRNLAKHGLRIGDVIERALKPQPIPAGMWDREPMAPRGEHQALVQECLRGRLSRWESGFVRDLLGRRALSDRQAEVLTGILNKVRRQRGPGGAA